MAVGEGVEDIQVGQRVAWVYSPDAIDDRTAASTMMAGLTASYFATNFYPVQPDDIALVHAAAGGVGLLLTQIIKLRGGRVIGRVSSESTAAIAKQDESLDHATRGARVGVGGGAGSPKPRRDDQARAST